MEAFGVSVPSVDVQRIALEMGVEIYLLKIENPGAIYFDESRCKAKITVNGADHPVRQRFTIAHELGHLMLEPDVGTFHRNFSDTTFTGTPSETRANAFAADLLVPLWMLAASTSVYGHDAARLAGVFYVSEAAMKIRLDKLLGR